MKPSRPLAFALLAAAAAAVIFVRPSLRNRSVSRSPAALRSAEALTVSAQADLDAWRWAEAEWGFRKALALNPASISARDGLGRLLILLGRFDDGLDELERARKLDPHSPERNLALASAELEARRYGAAGARCRKLLATVPRLSRARLVLAESLILSGRPDEALAECLSAVDPQGDPADVAELGYVFAAAGKKGEAFKIAAALSGKNPISPGCSIAFPLGILYAALDMREPAFRWFETAFRERAPALGQLRIDPRLDPLRGDPRYLDLVRRMGFPGD